jgi:hypothetical protein
MTQTQTEPARSRSIATVLWTIVIIAVVIGVGAGIVAAATDFTVTGDSQVDVSAGETATLTYTIENTGDSSLDSLALTPTAETAGVTITGVASDSAVSVTDDNRIIFQSVSPGETVTATVTVEVGTDVSDTQSVSVEAVNGFGSDKTVRTKSTSLNLPSEPASFNVGITSVTSPVDAGDTIEVTAQIDNTGGQADTQTVSLSVPGLGSDQTTTQLAAGESVERTLDISTTSSDAGEYTAEVLSADDSASVPITVEGDTAGSFLAIGVRDTSGNELANAEIMVNDSSGTTVKTGTTSSAGDFTATIIAGDYTIRASKPGYRSASASVSVQDGATTSADLVLRAVQTDSPPTADAGADQTVGEGDAVTLDASGSSDADGDTLSYEWTQTGGPSVQLSGATTAMPSFTAPDVRSKTTLAFEVTVDDGTTTATDTVEIAVEPDTSPPIGQVRIDDQSGDGTTVTVRSVTMSEGGFVVIHEVTEVGGAGQAIGASEFLSAGETTDIEVTLDEPLSSSQQVIAMPHLDTNGNQQLDFPQADGPYTINGSAVTDSAQYAVSDGANEVSISINGPSTAAPGDAVEITTTLENTGIDGATGGYIELTEVPAPLSVTGDSSVFLGFGGNPTPDTGETVSQSFEVTVPERTQTGQTLTVSAEGQLSSSAGDATATDSTTIEIAESTDSPAALSLTGPASAAPGDTVTVTAMLNNTGLSDAAGGSVSLTNLPDSLSVEGDSTRFLGFGGTPVPGLGESASYAFEVGIAEDASPGEEVTLTADSQLESQTASATNTATTQLTIAQSARFDTNGQPGIQRGEVVDAIVAFNSDANLGGQPVSRTDVVDVIVEFNS